MLSDRFIRNAKTGMYADEGGLYLQVYASGTKAFLHRSQAGGKAKKTVLGHYPEMSLADARAKLERVKNSGADRTVKEAFDEFFEHAKKNYTDKHAAKRSYERDVLPKIQDKLLSDLTRADLMALLKDKVRAGTPTLANATLSKLRVFLNYCVDMGWMDANPIERTKRAIVGGNNPVRSRTLTWDEVVEFIRWLWSTAHNTALPTRVALYLCLLTGQRNTEVLTFRLSDKPYLEGPAKRTRSGPVTYKVPLTTHVRACMKFYHQPPARNIVLSSALRRAGFDFTPHDLRRTFATRLADLGVFPHVIEKLLNHQMTGVMAVYNRSEYWDERVNAMVLWGRKLAAVRRQALKGQ